MSASGSGSAATTGSGGASGAAISRVSIATVSATVSATGSGSGGATSAAVGTGSGSGVGSGSGMGSGSGATATTTGSGSAASSAVGAGSSNGSGSGSGSGSTTAWATGSGAGSGAIAGSSSTAGAGGTVAATPAGRSVVCVPMNRSNQPAMRRSLSTRRSGRPLREMSCDSSGNRTSSAVWPSRRRAPNSSSDCEIAQRRSISPHVSSTYVIGERSHNASGSGHGGGPSSSSPHRTMSCCEYSLTRFEIERIDTAAEKRFVCPIAQLVMKPPYEPPPMPMRAVSTTPVRSMTWSSAVIRSM